MLAIQYKNKALTLQAECESAMAQNRINLNYGERTTPAYAIFHLKSGYRFQWAKLEANAGLSITNLLNKAYYEHLDWGRIFRPGRSVDVYLRVAI